MSSSLVYTKVVPKDYKSFSTELKLAMRKEFGWPVDRELTREDIGFLKGLRAAEVKDADILLELVSNLEENESIRIWEM